MPNSGPCDIGIVAGCRPAMYPNGVMPTSSTPFHAASNTSNGGTIAPPGWVSTLSLPADIFSPVSAHSLKIRCWLADAGWVDWPLRLNLCCAAAGAGAPSMRPAAAKALSSAVNLRIVEPPLNRAGCMMYDALDRAGHTRPGTPGVSRGERVSDFPPAFYAVIRGIDRFTDTTGRLIALSQIVLVAIITYE